MVWALTGLNTHQEMATTGMFITVQIQSMHVTAMRPFDYLLVLAVCSHLPPFG